MKMGTVVVSWLLVVGCVAPHIVAPPGVDVSRVSAPSQRPVCHTPVRFRVHH